MTLALSIRQPWASLILLAGKDIENRNWATGVRGPILIHAAKRMTRTEYIDAMNFAKRHVRQDLLPLLASDVFRFDNLPRGGIIGSSILRDCVGQCGSPWFQGEFGFLLGGHKLLRFHPCKGQLGFFDVPDVLP